MKRLLYAGGALALLAVAAVAYVLRPSEEAGAPIEAIPLASETAPAESAPTESGQAAAAGGTVVYVIVQADSEVRFSIDELLRNVPTTAVGVTNQVAGEIAINFAAPADSQVGVITVNARTLATDSSNRDRMIRNEILDTAEFEFITFTPSAITGLPAVIEPGVEVSFQIAGNLTIRSVTAPAVFDVTASLGDDGRLTGRASAVVLRSDYGLVIPSVPSVADVSDEVLLEIDFVAAPKE